MGVAKAAAPIRPANENATEDGTDKGTVLRPARRDPFGMSTAIAIDGVMDHRGMDVGVTVAIVVMSVAVGLWPARARAKEDPDPLAKLRRTDAEIRAAVNRRVPDWSPEAEVRRKQIERLLGGLLDYDAIARVALGPTFSGLARIGGGLS